MGLAIGGAFASAWANPTGPTLVKGAALISNPSANVLQVVNTPGTVLHWQGFSVGAGQTTRFVQQNAASAVLNRVVGANPSSILGRLESNGRVFLINPNGIVFGGGAVVDVAGLIASTRDISDANFAAGNYLFSGAGNGGITVQSGAQILTSNYGPGGQVWLIGRNVTQEAGSTITAPQGQVVFAAGTQLQVAESSLGNMTFNVTTDGISNISALGTIAAARGAVGMFADNITVGGNLSADSSSAGRGQIVMSAADTMTVRDGAVVSTDATDASQGGVIDLTAGSQIEIQRLASVSADGGAAGGNGGDIALTANLLLVSQVANAGGNLHA
ncbi:MAG: filamentous hemagglutinin N-terminal domain-containing protein, partial [Burkholderiales bacterium]